MLPFMSVSRLTSLLALLLCALVAGCGGDDDSGGDSGGEALPKAEFVEQANAICAEGNAETEEALGELENPTEEDAIAFLTDTFLPNVRDQVEEIRGLGFPEGDEETLTATLDEVESVLDTVEEDPEAAAAGDDPFAEVNEELNAYGLTECGSGA